MTNMGGWHTELLVPYLGIVRMYDATWMTSVKEGTKNPPLWCWTDKDGNRFTFSNGGYALTGEENTAEYKLVAQDGTNGEDGMDGVPGKPGSDGKTYYTWIMYADDAEGSGISNDPTGKKFIGLAYNKETPLESNNPADYKWSDITGEPGVPGEPGADGKTYYTWISYSDNADGSDMYQQPNSNTKYIGIAVNKLTPTEGTDPSEYTWSKFKGEQGEQGEQGDKGDKGDSVSNLGQWNTGLHVPYLGIVRMGTSSWMGSTKSGTNSPPLWCWTDKDGNRFTFSDGGYVLTGGENTAEYQLVATDGKNGEDGESIKGEDGLSGCTIRRAVWKAGVEWRNDADKATQPRYEDTALIKDDAVSTGWRAYQCLVTHTSSEYNKPGTSGGSSYWREYSLNTPDFFTNFILANGASIDLMQSNQVVVYTPEYVAEAGLTGKGIGSNTDVRIFGGQISGNEAPFMVMSDGSLVATKATITGKIYATEGWFRGNIETAESGKRIVISPTYNSLRMIDASNKELLKMWFSNLDGESYDSSRILMDKYIGGAKNAETDIMPGNISLVSIAGNMLTTLTSGGIILTNTANGNSITLQPEKTILFTSSGSYNGRTAYFNVSGIGGLRFINGLLVE